MLSRENLHDYQVDAIEQLKEREEALVWLGLGAGKTVISLTAIADLNMTALVVGTKRIVEMTWPQELTEWSHLNGLTYAAATGSKKQREKAVESNPQILGINYESLRWLYQTYGTTGREILILDESSKMKAHNTQRYRSHLKHMNGFERRYGLTATPASESYLGLFGQSNSIIEERPLGRTITDFRRNYTQAIFKGNFTEYVISWPAEERIRQVLSPWIDDHRPNSAVGH